MDAQAEPQVVLLTADRFSPWNGTRLNEPDHIWADFPRELDLPLLVYRGNKASRGPVEYQYGRVEETEYRSSDRWFVPVLLLQSVFLALRFGPRLLLGFRPRLLASRLKRLVLRQSSPGGVTRWHRVVVGLSRHFASSPPDVVVFHGEFDPWGTAVVWACRRAGVACVGHQHFAMPVDARHYRGVGRLGRFAPDGLLCLSGHQERLWSRLPIPVGFGGSRRPIWNIDQRSDSVDELLATLLIVPSVGDSAQLQQEISQRPERRFHVRPHPARMNGWNLPNVVLHDENLVELLGRFEAVVTSSPSPTVTLTAARQAFVKMRGDQLDGTCHCAERYVFRTLGELIQALDSGHAVGDLATRGCEHNLTDPPTREEYLSAIMRAVRN